MTLEIGLPESPQPHERADRGEDKRRRRGGRARWTLRVLLLLIALLVLTPLVVAGRVWYAARQDSHPKSDAIIVLGAAQYNGRPSPTLEWRLVHALKLYHHGVAPAIVTVGGKRPGDNYTEAAAGRRWLTAHGVPEGKVVAVSSGYDTLTSLEAVGRRYRQLDWHSGVIVTDPWHSLRSRTMAADNGIEAAVSPTRSGPSVQTRDTQFHYIVRETGGYLWYVTAGRLLGTQ
ncbi:MAG TPA: YdcF family protein [Streptosporangiaceae bacterium]|nr:YdcF family protein [Streptosporangiaceae bacterium]